MLIYNATLSLNIPPPDYFIIYWQYFVPLNMKGCICHFVKLQIHPFISKGYTCPTRGIMVNTSTIKVGISQTQKTREVDIMLVYCRPSITDGVLTVSQQWAIIPCPFRILWLFLPLHLVSSLWCISLIIVLVLWSLSDNKWLIKRCVSFLFAHYLVQR